jgi:hypothetical protein
MWFGVRLWLRLRLVAFLFDAAEFGERAEVATLHSVQSPEGPRESARPGGAALDVIANGTLDFVCHQGAEEARLDAHEAAAPVGVDEGIEEVALDGGLRM